MFYRVLLLISIYSCTNPPKPIILPPVKDLKPNLVEETIYTLGYMSEYDIWEFLKDGPSQKDVLDTFGLPDSVWLNERQSTKFLYYFIPNIQDYNTIEISAKTDSVSGFEWD